ncbi:ribosomal RNA large subunit methyltransferase J [Amanita rubescens]|nr:ribosomal RNA large subunit methyltransferase J [Amanita rubescens]
MSFRPSLVALSKKKSSQWIVRQTKDPYVKKRASDPNQYRSRSAFKLLEINDLHGDFLTKPDVKAVVDLGAAPGGWSQVVAAKFGYYYSQRGNKGKGTIIAVDLLRMLPIPGVEFLQADFLSPQAAEQIQTFSDGLVDVVLSDMAANLSGNDTRDIESSLQICNAVFEFAKRNLRTAESTGTKLGGVLLMKYFMDPSLQQFSKAQLEPGFHDVKYVKPPSSRASSREGFFLCRGWKGCI